MSRPVEPRPIDARLAPDVSGRIRAGALSAAPIAVGPAGADLEREIEMLSNELRTRHGDSPPAEIVELHAARELYRGFGIDPTKKRPSSESLLRRVLRGRPFPRVLNAVDVGNLLALRFLLPIGLYDADKIEPPVLLRAGEPGESYPGIRKDEIHLGGRPVVADRQGPFGNPTADSLRTSVDESTRALWLVVFAPPSFPVPRLQAHLETARETFERHVSAPDEPFRATTHLIEP